METELGSKLSKVLGDFNSLDLLGSRNRAGPIFSTKETETMFILYAQFKGYKRENIKVEIIENWTTIAITGEYPVEESLMVGMKVIKKETNMRKFRKAFRIPIGVLLNKIKANFNKHDSILTISMPKLLKEYRGSVIEEVQLDNFIRRMSDKILKIGDDDVSDGEIISPKHQNVPFLGAKVNGETNQLEKTRFKLESNCKKVKGVCIVKENDELLAKKATTEINQELVREAKHEEECSKVEGKDIIEENCELLAKKATTESNQEFVREVKHEGECSKVEGKDIIEENSELLATEETRKDKESFVSDETLNKVEEIEMRHKEDDESKRGKKPCSRKFCVSCKIAGSAFLLSLVLIVFHFVKEKNQAHKKKIKS